MWKCCFLDLVCGECTISVGGKKTDVQWQKEKNASANSFVFCFFLPSFLAPTWGMQNPKLLGPYIALPDWNMDYLYIVPSIHFLSSLTLHAESWRFRSVSHQYQPVHNNISIFEIKGKCWAEFKKQNSTLWKILIYLDIDVNYFSSEEQKLF